MPLHKINICIISPAYNEEEVIKKFLKSLPKAIDTKKYGVKFQTVVVDDGSTDLTIIEASKVIGVKVVRHLINMGPGGATRTGLRYARENGFDFAVTMDADFQHDSSDLLLLVKKMLRTRNVDILIGGRLKSSGNMPLQKRIGNRLLSYLTLMVFGVYIADSQSGFRVFSKKALDNLYFHSNGYDFCSEMLWQAKRQGLQIAEHPIKAIYTDYSKSKGQKNYSGAIKIIKGMMSRRLMDMISL